MVHSAPKSRGLERDHRSGRVRNVRTAMALVATMLGLFTLAVVYVSVVR